MERSEGEICKGVVGILLSNGIKLKISTQNEAKSIEHAKEMERRVDVSGETYLGGSIWKSGWVLANFLSADPSRVQDKRVVELGSGTGIGGLAAAALGARSVVLTDQTTFMAEYNLKRNLKACSDLEKRVQCDVLKWGDMNAVETTQPPFDLIIASDIMFVEPWDRCAYCDT
eukprot:gnl/TRDRNA2_/TRDRNA2_155821_c0_seq1.p1 gnl/TRDRNA2_/TRDRNA2_155821_c0~~gnl/TRDRNA2_/TRDRNA2_155821_c0_seq1.p1  ORF type:complete len:172 (+),score=27.96 gnl/TRDRNA2_/TRDRNA2_155821_c0_seq1:113-628(+)